MDNISQLILIFHMLRLLRQSDRSDRFGTANAIGRIHIDRVALQLVPPLCSLPEVAEHAQRTIIDDFDQAQNGHAHKQTNQAAAVGQEIGLAVQLGAVR